jgi:beta-N-acetylhexosaminidase
MADIRSLDKDVHAQPVLELWNAAFGSAWAMTAGPLWRGLSAPLPTQVEAHFVAVEGEQVVGVVATQFNRRDGGRSGGHIGALAVAPPFQRRGIGAALLTHACDHLRRLGAATVQLGGLYPRLWPGVAENLPDALAFFRAQGWAFDDELQNDLVGDLTQFEISPDLRERMTAEKLVIEPARTVNDVRSVLALQQRQFPGWYETYEQVARVGDVADILVARDPERGIVGSLVMCSPHSSPLRAESAWQGVVGGTLGGINEVGVASSERGRGIGIALVAWGSAVLRRRGVTACLIGWTSLADFYGKLGYQVWRRYHMSRRAL